MKKYRFNLIFATCFSAIITCVSWLVGLSIIHVSIDLRFIIVLINEAPIALSDLLTGNSHGSGNGRMLLLWLLAFFQWFIVGFILSLLFNFLIFIRHANQRKRTGLPHASQSPHDANNE